MSTKDLFFDRYAKKALDYYQERAVTFYKVDVVNYVRRDPKVSEYLDRVRGMFSKKDDLAGELMRALQIAVSEELKRKDGFGWRVFESIADPHARRFGRLWKLFDTMTLTDLENAQRQVRRERKEMLRKEDRYAVLIEVMRKRGRSATVGECKSEAEAEIRRRFDR
jgi:hypothetical protein